MSLGIADLASDGAPSSDEPVEDGVEALSLKIMATSYTEEGDVPVTHCWGRDPQGKRHHIEVVGHRPSFFINESAHNQRIDNHYAVYDTEAYDEDGERYKNLDGENLVRVYTFLPGQVKEMRDLFDETYEADVLYGNRFLIDSGVMTGLSVDVSQSLDYCRQGDVRVDESAVRPLGASEVPSIEPRVLTVDIEVGSEDGFPEADQAEWPVTTIVAHDSYEDEYHGWLLRAEEHTFPDSHADQYGDKTGLDSVRVFADESAMLDEFHDTVASYDADIFTGWYSNDFDYPYLINRSRNVNVWSYQDWSPLGETFLTKYSPVAKGVEFVDMLEAYKKTQIHNLKSKKLEDIAQTELGEGKRDVEMGHTEMWKQNPVDFLRYNRVDVELVTRIDEEVGVIDLLDNLRTVVGCSYTDPIGGNIDMMDMLFLRKAREYGYVLPTAEKPEKGWYYGAKVFTPKKGLDENVLYMDLASLYPNLIKQLNISPETLEKDEPDGPHSYSYIDTRPDAIKKETEPEPEAIYYRTDERGFVASLVDELIDLKNQYRGSRGMYAATKRITNSLYGVLSDSDSYNRGFRLFDWRMGESICLGGRRVVTECSELCLEWCEENGYEDAFIKMGDTDGYGVCLPSANGMEESLRAGYEMEKYVNERLPSVSADLFGIEEDTNEMEIECESYAERVFTKDKKKRYAQRMRWEK